MRKLILLGIATLLGAVDVAQVIESPDAVAILQKDALPKATLYTMPAGCVSDDHAVIARGKYLFHNLVASTMIHNVLVYHLLIIV